MVLDLITRDIASTGVSVSIDPNSPDPVDQGKFLIQGRPARVIHRPRNWMVPINLEWLHGSIAPPRIWRSEFYWYVFAIPQDPPRVPRPHYFVCDFHKIRAWVLEFDAPLGRDYSDQRLWRCHIHIDSPGAQTGYFRWGDEPRRDRSRPSRFIRLDNIADVALTAGGRRRLDAQESDDHRRLKDYIAARPGLLGLRPEAHAHVEYLFRTGDQVDILFEVPGGEWAVVEVEVEEGLEVGVYQAIKYRVLAAVEARLPIDTPRVRCFVAAFGGDAPSVRSLAERYGVRLLMVDRRHVLHGGSGTPVTSGPSWAACHTGRPTG